MVHKASRKRQSRTTPRRLAKKPKAGGAGMHACEAFITVEERVKSKRDHRRSRFYFTVAGADSPSSRRQARRSKKAVLRTLSYPTVRQAICAAAHSVRVRIMVELLEGPAIYRTLKKLTKLKPGPLYHHINQLRLGGLINPKERDLYELTRGGRNLILVLAAARTLIHDKRRRPQASGVGK